MKLLILISLMLGALVTSLESVLAWQKLHKLPSKHKSGHKDCNCLNGGTCISYQLFSRINRCLCPKGYSGQHCEIDTGSQCYREDGQDYRGTVSKNEKNEECLSWDSPLLIRRAYHADLSNALELGLGKHNYCRNPNGKAKPWCYIKRGYQTLPTACDIQLCPREIDTMCGQRSSTKNFKIVSGSIAAIESQPWIATIFYYSRRTTKNFFVCGGSLIDPCWVLTAAHCFSQMDKDSSGYTVILGKSKLDDTDDKEQTFQVERIITHDGYSDETGGYNNDIALMRIKSASGRCAVESDYVKTICLPPENLVMRDNSQCEVSGYGKEDNLDIYYSQILKSANVNVISQSLCRDEYYDQNKVNDNMICAGDVQWKTDACKGDSGGPLVCEHNGRMSLYGIVSWGEGCAKENRPGVYTRVTRYLSWIDYHMRGVNFKSRSLPK
ncbi:urokinase-type plasminogen activator isoform X2 [Emydura macquarii macquarii]|uniref:urokinase-type plasminogen activator isoform X2 n=1 Tax=Emydura macquarii macquarii TaxID=1129001 RepID=UPI00352B17B6